MTILPVMEPTPISTPARSAISTASPSCSTASTPHTEWEFNNGIFETADFNNSEKYILITGGLGYIGSHTTLELLKAGLNVVLIDDLSNSYLAVLERIRWLVAQHYKETAIPSLDFYQIDYRDTKALRAVFDNYALPLWTEEPPIARRSKITGVIHFAAYKAVAESIRVPLTYYSNNVAGFTHFLETLNEYGIKTLVFSSSATVYGTVGQDESLPISEEYCVHAEEGFWDNGQLKQMEQGCNGVTSPYGRTKWMCEAILSDLCASDPEWRAIALRYFNPIGCDPSGLLGEDPLGIPNNLMPIVCKVLRGHIPVLNVFGSDYGTVDGTGVRDFIHVSDLATGHLAAIRVATFGTLLTSFRTYNLGSGHGHSVLELVETMSKVSNKKIPLRFTDRRNGDVAMSVAKPLRAEKELNWKTEYLLIDACRDTWNFLLKNPQGYRL